MVADTRRMQAYVDALRRTVTAESVVLDLGAGLGAFAVSAFKLGARRVIAVEPNDVIEVARAVARDNGCDRIEFIRTVSQDLTLTEPATVIVSDLRGPLPIYEHHLPSIVDARRRLLADDGILIPQADSLHAALVEAPEVDDAHYGWASGDNAFDIDLSAARGLARNSWRRVGLEEDALLAEPSEWLSLDYRTIEGPDVTGTVAWTVARRGTAHGFAVWFDTTLVDDVGFSNRPGAPPLIYEQAFFPLERPVEVDEGDSVALSLSANLVVDEYVWRWNSAFEGSTGSIRFRQSTLLGSPLSLEQLRRSSPQYVPTLGEEANVDLLILDTLSSGGSLEDAAERAAESFAGRYRDASDALPYVANVAARYARIGGGMATG